MTIKQRIGSSIFRHMPITRFLFDQLRWEANSGLRRVENAISPARRRRLAAIRKAREIRINVACGPQVLPGFVNIDLIPFSPDVIGWDCRRSLPVETGSAAGIRAEQFIEHLDTREELPAFLGDCRRALKSGGVLRLIVPDAERYVRAYCKDDLSGFRELVVPSVDPFPSDLPTRMDIVNHIFHQWNEHRWAYDYETLVHRLSQAGFENVQRSEYGRSLDPELANDREVHSPYSLYVEAVR